jgi:hypothetical protein
MGLKPLQQKLLEQLDPKDELTEPRVVFMMVCVRKLLEIEPLNLQSLKFHCDWALHSRLERTEAVKVIKLFDDLESALRTKDDRAADKLKRKLHRIVDQGHFRRELEMFLEHHQLPPELSVLSARWIPFWKIYMNVIHDVPLEFTATPTRSELRIRREMAS